MVYESALFLMATATLLSRSVDTDHSHSLPPPPSPLPSLPMHVVTSSCHCLLPLLPQSTVEPRSSPLEPTRVEPNGNQSSPVEPNRAQSIPAEPNRANSGPIEPARAQSTPIESNRAQTSPVEPNRVQPNIWIASLKKNRPTSLAPSLRPRAGYGAKHKPCAYEWPGSTEFEAC